MSQEVLNVPEVHCDHCVASIEGAVGKLDGIRSVTVDLASKKVAVDFDESKVSTPEIVTTIVDQGYDVNP